MLNGSATVLYSLKFLFSIDEQALVHSPQSIGFREPNALIPNKTLMSKFTNPRTPMESHRPTIVPTQKFKLLCELSSKL